MIYRRRRNRIHGVPGGFHHFQDDNRRSFFGFGEGDYIRLRDEYGNQWRGWAERLSDKTVRYVFTDQSGKRITGVSDTFGVMLRDEHGKTWRGFVDG